MTEFSAGWKKSGDFLRRTLACAAHPNELICNLDFPIEHDISVRMTCYAQHDGFACCLWQVPHGIDGYENAAAAVSRHLSVNKFVKFLWTVFQTSDTMK